MYPVELEDWQTRGAFFCQMGEIRTWGIKPQKTCPLLHAVQQGEILPFMAKVNKNGVQISILIIQGIIVSLLASLCFIMDNVSVAFFVLSAMTVTLYLVMNILMYSTAIKLRYTQPDLPRPSICRLGTRPGMSDWWHPV